MKKQFRYFTLNSAVVQCSCEGIGNHTAGKIPKRPKPMLKTTKCCGFVKPEERQVMRAGYSTPPLLIFVNLIQFQQIILLRMYRHDDRSDRRHADPNQECCPH